MNSLELVLTRRGSVKDVRKEAVRCKIKVDKVSKSFGNQKVIDEVSLNIEYGEICGIVGNNGSGKSVLFKCVCGLLFTDEGEITVDGKTLHKDIDMVTDAGVIIEEPAFLAGASGFKNLDYLYGIRNKRDRAYIESVLEIVGLDPKSTKHVKNYSMGMKQRLAIAQAIMEKPSVLILDEPMNGLDKAAVAQMRELFKKINDEGTTIIIASHNQADIDILCDHVYEMDAGRLTKIR